MLLPTKAKISLARKIQRLVMTGRRWAGMGPMVDCRRGGLRWQLDLREGIDFSIFLLGSFEPDTIAAYRRLIPAGATVIDIGANIGAHTLPLAVCVGPGGQVIAIEPTSYAFERLQHQISLNADLAERIRPVQAMLMGDPGIALVAKIESSWPLDSPENAHPQHGGVAKCTSGAAVTTLDVLVDRLSATRVDFVKLDVDGYEVEVLRGAQKAIAKFLPTIIFEHAPYTIREKGYDPAEMIGILGELGYVFADLRRRPLENGGKHLPQLPIGSSLNLLAIPAGRRREAGLLELPD